MCPARLTNAQKVSIVQLHLKNGGHVSETVRQFKVLYPTNRTLVPSTALKVIAKLLEHGSVENRWKGNCGRKKTVRTAANIATIGNTMAATPTTSIRRLQAQNPGVTKSGIQRMLKKDLGMQGYRASLVQELKEDDPALRIERNAITWAMTNPHISMDKPYQKKGIMVWASLFKDQLIGPYFFTRGTVTGEKYLYMLKEIVWPIEVLFEDDVPHMHYQQDGASAQG
ncbi:hypothetical protein EMCRGX_G019037 [Ephydatia muelleri]